MAAESLDADAVDAPDLDIEQVRVGHRVVLGVSGELDVATADTLRAAASDALASGLAELWIDFSALGFMDSSGLHAVFDIRKQAREADKSLAFICPPGRVRRVFAVAGVEREFAIYADRAAAHAAH